MATAKKIQQGGFDCEFVERPPTKFIQSECPVCLLTLREPYQAPCCGKSFCRVCIEKIKADNKLCPTCNEVNFVTFHNKGLQCTLYGFQVYCSHKQEGCEWKGELGQLDDHLNLSPEPDNQQEGCEYSEIECIHCSELIRRSSYTLHQNELCPKRPFSCEYCHSYETYYDDVIHNHWPVCGFHPVRCPNECGTFPQRQVLENHITTDCPNAVLDCDFHHVGCEVKLPRKDMPAHLQENLITHMSLQAASYSKLLASHDELKENFKVVDEYKDRLHEKIAKIEIENDLLRSENIHLQKSIKDLEKELKQHKNSSGEYLKKYRQHINDLQTTQRHIIPHTGVLPYKLVMHNCEEHMKQEEEWLSPPFYTHNKGYKLCLGVDFDRRFVFVTVYLMRGEFDDKLVWPFRGTITLELVDKNDKEDPHEQRICFNDFVPRRIRERVTRESRNHEGQSIEFISMQEVHRYISNNLLYFRITKIRLC